MRTLLTTQLLVNYISKTDNSFYFIFQIPRTSYDRWCLDKYCNIQLRVHGGGRAGIFGQIVRGIGPLRAKFLLKPDMFAR